MEECYKYINTELFQIVWLHKEYAELLSKTTGHCWLIQGINNTKTIVLYHKYHSSHNYHYQGDFRDFTTVLSYIEKHDVKHKIRKEINETTS